MSRSDAESLWEAASLLARDAAKVSRAGDGPIPGLPPLLFFTDPLRTPRPWEIAARLPPGAGVVYRAFGAADARETAGRLREATARRDGLLLIGLDAALAEAVGADGLHLPERALGDAEGLAATHPEWRITGAIHRAAARDRYPGLDAVVLSPVFAAGGASSERPPLGVEEFARLARACRLPAYALGGVNAGNARSLIGSGACGLAAIAGVAAAFGPAVRI